MKILPTKSITKDILLSGGDNCTQERINYIRRNKHYRRFCIIDWLQQKGCISIAQETFLNMQEVERHYQERIKNGVNH